MLTSFIVMIDTGHISFITWRLRPLIMWFVSFHLKSPLVKLATISYVYECGKINKKKTKLIFVKILKFTMNAIWWWLLFDHSLTSRTQNLPFTWIYNWGCGTRMDASDAWRNRVCELYRRLIGPKLMRQRSTFQPNN